ncbi:thermonuclease family protein [Saccharopolyspora rhizosphaerae]|uniref:thermonuclease family protein n=1 Tax=Saccharopolyspora rhizosphaerae TaxID=2492662 RepID=UPI0013154B3B|nr:thermonuclease family protein [Saccharopolyspora rhizosphaerae]
MAAAKVCSYSAATVYDGVSCVPGGERVAVSRAVDGDTLELSDGRRVRLLGVDTPEQGECGFDEATENASRRAVGKEVWLFREPEVTTDQHGRELAYVDVARTGSASDLGWVQAVAGHAESSSDSDANAAYEERIRSVVSTATGPCEQPASTPQQNYYAPVPGDGDGDEDSSCRRTWSC